MLLGAALALALGASPTRGQTLSAGPPFDAGLASRKLELGMTEEQLVAAIGRPPNKVDMRTCGQNTPNPWQCKILTFFGGAMGNNLVVYLEGGLSNLNFRVNSWNVY